MKNRYEIRGKVTAIFIERRNGDVYEALIDTEDLPKVMKYRSWRLLQFCGKWNKPNKFYCLAYCGTENGKRIDIMLHHLVLGKPPKGMMVDHINGNPLDNRKCNLRFVTNQENQLNRSQLNVNNRTGYPGVVKVGTRYRAQFKLRYKTYYVGTFDTPKEAYQAREAMRKKILNDLASAKQRREA